VAKKTAGIDRLWHEVMTSLSLCISSGCTKWLALSDPISRSAYNCILLTVPSPLTLSDPWQLKTTCLWNEWSEALQISCAD